MKPTILIEGIYTSQEKEEVEQKIEEAENLATLLEHNGLDVIKPQTTAQQWINNPESYLLKHNKLLKENENIKVLFMRNESNNHIANKRFREIQEYFEENPQNTNNKITQNIWNESEIETLLKTYAPQELEKNKKFYSKN